MKHKKKNSMTEGTTNFRKSTITRHAESRDHREAMADEVQSKKMVAMADKMSESEKAVIVALKTMSPCYQ